MTFDPAPSTWRVTRVNEDLERVVITLTRTRWRRDVEPDNEETETVDASAGEPGAFWEQDETETRISFPSQQAVMFDVGRHYVMELREIVDAPLTAYETA